MTIQTKSNLRRFLSLSAFTALIAAVTMAFADVPTKRTELHFANGEPALSIAPAKSIRLAKAPSSKAPVASTAKSRAPKNNTKKTLSGTLNLNTATASDLIKLPGIGPKKAASIVAWRGRHGKFDRVVDLRRVKGFGAKSVKKLLPYLSIKGASTLE